jgi:hypothetical protein
MDSIRMDELHGIFTTYEMRTKQENLVTKEVAFKASKKSKKKGNQKAKEYRRSNDISEDDEEVSNFVKRLKKEIDDKYRCNLPLICFNCNGIGQFSNKFPHKKNKRN